MASNLPRYEKLIHLLKEKLTEGQFHIGDRFFSQNELMKKYNLSFATVTRALNELEREGLLIREQGRGTFVRALPDGRRAAGSQQRLAAVFIPWDIRNPAHVNFQKLYTSIESSLPANYTLKLVPYSQDASDLEKYFFTREKLDGLLFAYPGRSHIPFVRRISRMYPTVVIGQQFTEPLISTVYTDNRKAAELAVTFLIEKGHRTIGLISGSMEMTDSQERLDGYREALTRHGIPYRESLVAFTHPYELNGYGALIDLSERNSDLDMTAVFAAGDLLAVGALAAARSIGRRVPDELSVIGFDDIEMAATLDPPLTTIHVPIPELARRATELLSSLIEHEGRPEHIELPATLVVRESVRSAGAK